MSTTAPLGRPLIVRARLLALAPAFAGAAVCLLSLIVLAGWQLGIERLKRISPEWVAMNPTTALCLLLAGIAILLLISFPGNRRAQLTVRILASLVALYGLQRLLALFGGPDFQLDTRFFNLAVGTDAITDAATRLNRVAPNTAFLMTLSSAALFLSTTERSAPRLAAKALALLAGFIALIGILGYLNGLSSLYRPTALTPMALHTAIGFLLTAGALLALRAPAAGPSSAASQDLSAVRRNIALGFGAALFVLALVGIIANAGMQALVRYARDADVSRRLQTALADTARAAAQHRTEQQLFALTGDPIDAARYQAAAAALRLQIADLQHACAGNPTQQPRALELTPLLDTLLATPPTDAHRQQLLAQELSTRLDAMSAAESAGQSLRDRQSAHSYDTTTFVITVGIALAFALVGTAGWLISRDLLLKQRIAEELRNAHLAANAASEAKGAFLANMSHEIRTPMSAIIGYADLILDPHQTADDRAEYVNTIRRNGEHLLRIINDILDLSKIEAGKLEIERTGFCPCQVLSDVASLMRVRAAEKRLKLDIRNEGPIPAQVHGDPARLRQILINLLGNAIKFTEDGWVRLIMKLDESGPAPLLQFDVIDTGIGMSREEANRLFQPFVQADVSTTRRFGGTGLGLTICKRLAEMLGGNITIDSAPNRGSTFTLRIDPGPLDGVRRLQNCREALAGTDRPQSAGAPAFNARVLLVDDGEDNRRLLSLYLARAGAQVSLAENGRSAVDLAQAALAAGKPFHVILMDMQMPVLDGYAAATLLRAQGYQLPIIALTANAMAEDCDKCLSAGCTDYLSKPVRRERLLLTVARHLPPEALITSPPAQPSLPAPAVSDPITSDLTDESLRPLLNAYLHDLPHRVAELENALAQRDLQRLASEIHNLKGSGGLYGLMPISAAATTVESSLKQQRPLDAITAQVRDLIALIHRVQGVPHAPAATPPAPRD
ncbi:MAG TPA: ATP-binding protein [Phycisphaerae bacterium]|nr:ATP-binding protein [Phycisphaerae bacterium]